MSFGEDDSRLRVGHGAENFSRLLLIGTAPLMPVLGFHESRPMVLARTRISRGRRCRMGDLHMRSFSDFSWRDIGDGFQWEFADANGECLAEVSFEEERMQKWSWYVTLPLSSQDGNGSPCGLARSAAAAKSICETILLGTVLEG